MFEVLGEPVVLSLFFLIAVLYSSVGHGGASGYLALFAILGVASSTAAPTALVLNVFVAGISFYNYYRAGFFPAKLFFTFAVTSIPSAFLGGLIHPSARTYQLLLGAALLFASTRMLFAAALKPVGNSQPSTYMWLYGGIIGCVLGFVSGMIGIGGGIFLSPILLLAGWADVKHTAGVSSAFIVANSLSGIFGHVFRGNIHLIPFIPVMMVVIIGGLTGSLIGSRKANERLLQRLLGIVLLVAGSKMLMGG